METSHTSWDSVLSHKIVLLETSRSSLWVVENFGAELKNALPTDRQASLATFANNSEMFTLLQKLKYEIEPPIKIYGKVCHMQRNILFLSNDSEGYRYSGQLSVSVPLDKAPILGEYMNYVNAVCNTKFNGILVNQYVNGTKYVSAHSDNENGLDSTKSMVVGLAYGATRTFRIRKIISEEDENGKKKPNPVVLNYKHKPGTLIVMEGDFQKEFQHEIPIEKRVKDERISITFRRHTS